MKTITALFFVSFLFFFASCGEDNITNNNSGNNNSNTLFEKDSISVWTFNTGTIGITDSVSFYLADTNLSIINIQFLLQCNLDSNSGGIYAMQLYNNDTNYFLASGSPYSSIDSLINFSFNVFQWSAFRNFFFVTMAFNNSSIPKYIRFKDIKITKI